MMEVDHQNAENEINDNTITTMAENHNHDDNDNSNSVMAAMSRKEKKKALKKMKRKQIRKEMATKEREIEEARLNDPEEQMRLLRLEQEENERMARERMEFEERERMFLQALELKKKRQEEEEEEERRKILEESQRNLANNENGNEVNDDDGWEYVEEGPAEIIWKGNEIIVKKKKVRVPKKAPDVQKEKQESARPISNPLAPQSEAFNDYKSAQEVLESVAQQVPNFGTEQDKAHCPFHLKTGVCRFGARCSRVHFYPDKACTLLIKNMYNGPGLAWEQDEGLEYTDEEVERGFEDFYEDAHTEFLKFGEIVNFKVCKNASSHLRGNVYVHYRSLESATAAYQSINGRYFAGKQLTCEYVNLTRWRVAICGEYMKSRFKTCSRGSACNFIHCFRNPGADYEWADWDKPAPRYWLKKMAALFGYTDDGFKDEASPGYRSRRSRSTGLDSTPRERFSDEDDGHRRRRFSRHRGDCRETNNHDEEMQDDKRTYQNYHRSRHRETDNVGVSEGSSDDQRSHAGMKRSSKRGGERRSSRHDSKSRKVENNNAYGEPTDGGASNRYRQHKASNEDRQHRYDEKSSRERNKISESADGEGRYGRDEKRPQKYVKKNSRLKNRSGLTDTESDRDEDRRHRHSKHHSKYDTELLDSASDGDRVGRYEKRPQKSRRTSSRSKKESDIADMERKRELIDEGKKHHGHRRSVKHHIKESGLPKDDSNAYRCSRDGDRLISGENDEAAAGNFGTDGRHRSSHADMDKNHSEQEITDDRHCGIIDQTARSYSINHDVEGGIFCRFSGRDKCHNSSYGGLVSERDRKRSEHMPPIHNSDEEATVCEKVETSPAHTSCQDFNSVAEAELEKACRRAALKKLEEIRSHEDTKLETSVASIKRKRI